MFRGGLCPPVYAANRNGGQSPPLNSGSYASRYYKLLGFTEGQPADFDEMRAVWNNAHSSTLEDYGIKEDSRSLTNNPLYHPDAAKYFFDWR